MHKFLYVPLVYSKLNEMLMLNEQRKNSAMDPVLNQFYSMFQEYNLPVKADNQENSPSQAYDLPDPCKALAVRKFLITRRFFGEEYTCNTDAFVRRSSSRGWELCMQDRQIMSYMMALQK